MMRFFICLKLLRECYFHEQWGILMAKVEFIFIVISVFTIFPSWLASVYILGVPLGGGITSSMSLGLVRFQSFLMITFSSSFCWSMGPEGDKSNTSFKGNSTQHRARSSYTSTMSLHEFLYR